MPDITVTTPIDTFMASADQAAMRTNLGLGTAATTAASDYATAAQGALADSALQPTGDGSGLTSLNASELASGTVPDARFPATLPAVSGTNLTALNANNLGSGTVPDARFPATLPAVSGANLTALNAGNLASGTVPDARFPATLPAVSGANLTALNASNLGSGIIPDARFPATLPAVSGANLTALNASNLGSGTVPDARFPATLPTVSGANLTSLNASNLASGTVPTARLGTGTADNTTYLRGDGTWATPGGSGGLTGFTGTLETASPNNTVNASVLTPSGGTTNQDSVLAVKGTGAIIGFRSPDGTTTGGNKRGTYAVDFQGPFRSSAADVASGSSSGILFGQYNQASNAYAVAGGYLCIASGQLSTCFGGQLGTASNYASTAVGGYGAISSGQSSVVVGGESCTASASYSFAGGFESLADRYGARAYASGRFAAKGDSQTTDFNLRCKTTTNAAVEMFLDGSFQRLTIPSGKVITFFIILQGVKSDGSAVACYMRQYTLKNVAGTTSEVYAPVAIGTDNAAGTSVSITANDTNDALNISPTGITSETWRWSASVRAVETAYGT